MFAFMAMLYWSSSLVEQDLKFIRREMVQINHELLALKKSVGQGQSGILKAFHEQGLPSVPPIQNLQTASSNLLTPDPFYIHTLPALLGPDFKPEGIRREATIGKPKNLNPFSGWSEVATWIRLCSVSVADQKVGIYETMAPSAALSMELRKTPEGRPEYWIFLRQDLFWQSLNPNHFPADMELASVFLQKHPVTAHDFKFYYDAIMNPHVEEAQAVALRNYFNEIEEIRVIDDLTLVVRWKTKKIVDAEGKESFQMKYSSKLLTGSLRPLARFVYQYFADGTKIVQEDEDPNTYLTNPVWSQNFSHHWASNIIVSCGPWLFDGMTEGGIRFRRNPDFYDSYGALIDAYEEKFRDSPDAIWQDFKIGNLDLFTVPPNLLAELDLFLQSPHYLKQTQNGLAVKKLNYLSRMYQYVGWNETNPLFNNRIVRQALTMAIDRDRIIRQNLNGMGIQTTGTFFPYSPSYDSSLKPYPFDPDQARRLLQQEGWYDSDGDGIIDKLVNGQRLPFRFTLTYFVKSPTSKAICEYISTALKEIGIDCRPNGVDMADLSAVFDDKNFDALVLAWVLGTPPEDPRQLWYSAGAAQKGSSNAIGFANAEADKIIEELDYEHDPKKRIELYHRFDAIIYEEAPYTFLCVPKTTLAYRDYLQNVFIPKDRQDLIPGANVGEPEPSIFWIRENKN
jgi:peptide/nickel transport system substrate-binding protein